MRHRVLPPRDAGGAAGGRAADSLIREPVEAPMGATTPAPKSRRRSPAQPRRGAAGPAPPAPVEPAGGGGGTPPTGPDRPVPWSRGPPRGALPGPPGERRVPRAQAGPRGGPPVPARPRCPGELFHKGRGVGRSVQHAAFQAPSPRETLAEWGLPAELYNGDVFEW